MVSPLFPSIFFLSYFLHTSSPTHLYYPLHFYVVKGKRTVEWESSGQVLVLAQPRHVMGRSWQPNADLRLLFPHLYSEGLNFITSFNFSRYLLKMHFVPGTVLGVAGAKVQKGHNNSALTSSFLRKTDSNETIKSVSTSNGDTHCRESQGAVIAHGRGNQTSCVCFGERGKTEGGR